MQRELADALDALYAAFELHARPDWVEACACCWDGEAIADTGRWGGRGAVRVPGPGEHRALRGLGADELRGIAADVPLTAGDTAVLQHYLPRILEIAAADGFDWPVIEVILGHLAFSSEEHAVPWTLWSDAEQGALRSFMRALWRDTLAATDGSDDDLVEALDDRLCAIGQAEPHIGWYLAEWLRFEQPAAAAQLLRFLDRNRDAIAEGELWNTFWENDIVAESNAAVVVTWLRAPDTCASVMAAAERARSDEEAAALAACIRQLNDERAP